MLQPKKPLDLSSAKKILERDQSLLNEDRKPLDLSSAQAILKKKDGTNSVSTSTTPTENTASVQKVGSSATPKLTPEEKAEFDTAFKSKTVQQPKLNQPIPGATIFDTAAITEIKNPKPLQVGDKEKIILNQSRMASAIPKEKDIEFEQEFNAKLNNEGFLNQAKKGLKEWWNNVIDVEPKLQVSTDHLADQKKKATDELRREGIEKPTEKQLQERTKEIFVDEKKKNYKQSLINKYIESLSEEDRELVSVKLAKDLPTLNKDLVEKSNALILMEKDLKGIQKELSEMDRIASEQQKMGNQVSPEFEQEYNRLADSYNNKLTVAASMDKDMMESKAKLGSAMEEYDNFKRSYNDFDVLGNRLKTGTAKIGYGLASFKNYLDRADRALGTEIEGFTPEIKEIEENERKVSFANKVIDKEQEYFRKRLEEVNTAGDFVSYVTDVAGDQIPNMLPFMLTGGAGGGAVIFGSSTGNQYAEMVEGEINPTPFSRVYTNEEKFVAPLIFGTADTVLSAIPTYGRLLRGKRAIQASLANEAGQELFAKSAFQTAKKGLARIGKDNLGEQLEEQGANLIQNFTRVVYLKEQDASMLDGVEDVFKDTATFSTLLSAFPVAMGGVINAVTPKTDIASMDENSKQIIALKQRIAQGGLSTSQKEVIQSQIDKKVAQNKSIVMGIQKNMESKGEVVVAKVNEVNKEIDKKLTQAQEIKEGNLTKSQKEVLLQGLKEDYKTLSDRREFLLSDKSSAMDVLPIKEVDKLKREALAELTKELNPDGTKNIEIKDEQITERANKIYAKQIELKRAERAAKKLEEAQPQSEKQAEGDEVKFRIELLRDQEKQEIAETFPNAEYKPDGKIDIDKLSIEDQLKYGGIYMKYDKLISPLLEQTNEATPANITPTNEGVQLGTNQMGEVAVEQQPTAEAIEEGSVQSANDVGEVEAEVDINDIENFLNEQFGNKKPIAEPEKKQPTKAKKEVAPKEEKVDQAKGFISIALDKLTTSLKDFQGRGVEYSKQTYDRIVNEAKQGVLNISAIPPVQIWKDPKTGEFVILGGHSRTKAFSDLASGEIQYDSKYKKSDFTNINAQIVEAETLEEAQKIAQESNQGAAQTVVDNAKYVREKLLPTFQNFNQAKTKLSALYGKSWVKIFALANLNPKGKAMQMLNQFQDALESKSYRDAESIAEWVGKARADFDKLTNAHENEIFEHLLKNDKIKSYSELSILLNNRVNGLVEFNENEPLNFEQKVGRGSNEAIIEKEVQELRNRDAQIKKKIKDLQSFGKNINETQRQQIKQLTAESIKINTVDIPNAQKKQKQARVADAEQFDIFSQINEQIENGNITPEQVDEFVNDDRKAEEIEPIVKAVEGKAKSDKKVELKQVINDVENQIERKPTDRRDDGAVQQYKGKPLAEQENKRPGIVVQAESKMPPTKNFVSKDYEIDEVQKQGVNSALSLFENGGKSFLLADGTGVGKTRQILVTAKEYLDKFGGKVLIISENTTILTKNFANDAKALGIDMNEFEFGTYNDLRTGKKGKDNYGLVIYDEAHNLKNQDSGKAIAAGNIKSKNNMYVTATPMDTIGSAVYFISEVSGVTEEQAYSMLGLNVKKEKDPITGQEIKIVTLQEGVAPADIKRNIVKIREEIIAKGAMLRREYPFYGEFIEDKISLTEEQANEQDEIESSWDDRIEYESVSDDGRVNFRKKMNLSGQKSGELSRWSESTKIKYTFKEVVKAIKDGKKVVVIAEGVNETTITAIDKVVPGFLSELSKMLKAEGYKVAEIFGKSDKGEANDKFQSNEVDVVLGTAKSASTGIDLDDQNGDAPRVLFMVTPNYSGNVFQQILGRVSRRNTKSPAQIRLLFNESNIDARRKQIVNGKLQTLKAIQEGVIDDEIEIDIQEAPVPSANVSIDLEGITLENISEKAFVIKGDTRPIKDNIKAIGGKYNPKYGWMFPIGRKAEVQEMLNNLAGKNEPTNEAKKLSDKVRSLKVNLGKLSDGGLQSNPLGLPVAIWNTSMDIIATSIDAGMEIAEAIKKGLNYIQKNHRGQWNKKQFNDEVLKELGVRGIEINGQDLIVKQQSKENAEVVNGFYSDIEKSLIDTKKDNLTAKEWETVIGKTDEVKWTGLGDWLNSQNGTVSKSEIRQFLKENRIEIREVEKTENLEPLIDSDWKEYQRMSPTGIVTEYSNNGWRIEKRSSREFHIYRPNGEKISSYWESLQGAKTRIEQEFNEKGDTKFKQYQLDGEKENYKEVLVTLPNRIPTYGEYQKMLGYPGNSSMLEQQYLNQYGLKQITDRSNNEFKSSHFDEKNILVHLRMNTRTDADGNKVLFLEEIQSDWGQKGKKEGFKGKDKISEYDKILRELLDQYNVDTESELNEVISRGDSNRLDRASISVQEFDTNIPSAPFVTDTNSWTKLGLKVALKEAVSQNVDKIAWTTGEQQNERYDLSKQVRKIDWRMDGKEYTLSITSINNNTGRPDNIIKAKDINEVESYVGKEVAKTIEQESEKNKKTVNLDKKVFKNRNDRWVYETPSGYIPGISFNSKEEAIVEAKKSWSDSVSQSKGEIEGEGLKVGGKGMKGFYGSPKEGKLGIVGEVAKALTNQEPKTVKITVNKYLSKQQAKERFKEGDFLFVETPDKGEYEVNSLADIDDAFSKGGKIFSDSELSEDSKQHSIDITPELKAEVSKGVPMFGNLKEQRKAMVNAEVDKIAQKVKDLLPGIKDPDLKKQGFSQDQLIDLVATAVKNLIAAGIEIDEAIKQVVASIKDKFGIDVNVDDVKAKIEGTKKQQTESDEDFERKPSKKSLLNRAVSGGESSKITDAISEYGLDYEIESQEKAQESAKSFVEKVGFDNALEVVRSNKIKGAEKAFVYAELIDILTSEIDSQIDGDERIALEEKHYQIMAEIMNEFDTESRDAGRFISALNRVYNSTNFKYNLSRQVKAYKARNNGKISAEKLQEYKEIDAKLKDLEQKIKEAEQRAMEAEAKLAMENIVEEVQRTSKKPTPQSNAKKAKDLANKIRRGKINKPDIFMSATPASLVWDGAIEIVAKSIEAGGSIADSVQKGIDYIKKSDWYKNLNDSDKKRAEKGLHDHIFENTKPAMVYIDEDGNIKVPESLIRSLVEQGVEDIDDLSEKVLDTIIDEYPELTLRQVRDAITKYGKTINPNPEKIASEIRKLRRMGKLISGLEDAKSGKRPLRSGLQRDELTQDERKMKRELRDLLRDLPLDDDSIERTWKTALDAIKSRLRNQIEDLEKQIANKEKSKPEKTPIEYDQEAKELKQVRDELKETLENIVGKPELTYEQRVTRSIASLERSISKLDDQISTKNIEYKTKPTPVTSAKIEELKEQKKKLTEEVNQMRIDSGVAEARRLQLAKSRLRNRIVELETRIKDKNYTIKKPVPVKADQELLNLQAEKIRTQERYDKDKYIDELNNRSRKEKIFDELLSIWNIARVVTATGELSWIMIQGGIQTISRTLSNPRQMFEIFKKMFKAMASESKAKEYESITKARENYTTMKQSKLALTEVDHKLEAKEEQFLGDLASALWDLFGKGLGKISNNKEFKSPYAFMMELLGKELRGSNKATLEQYWKNANPLRILERGNSVYMNELRVARFEDGMQILEADLKNPIDNLEEYKKLASAINTMTGRANIGMLQSNSKLLSVIFFSFRNAVSVINQLNPYFYLSLGNPKEPFKPSVAQKIAITDMMKFVTTTTGMLLLLQAALGYDDEDEPVATIETDPRSSDFGKLKIGNIRIDPWHGMMPAVTLISRIWTDENKNVNTGEISKGGTKFGSRTREQLMLDFATNKFNPSMGILWKYLSSHHEEVDGKEIRVDRYGKEYDVLGDVANLKPMYWEAISEIKKEQPGLWGDFFITTAALGINSQVYDKPKEKKNSYQRPRRPSIPRPPRP
jgi:hypothetical protein